MSADATEPAQSERPVAREATIADIDDLVRLDALAREHMGPHRGGQVYLLREARPLDSGQSYRADIVDHTRFVVVGCVGGVVAGFAVAGFSDLHDGTRLADVGEIFVEEPAREVGIGEALMETIVSWATDNGCRGIDARVLPGDRNSKNFFETFGLVARAITVHRDLRR